MLLVATWGTEENNENLSQDSLSPGLKLNSGPPEYEAGALTTRPRRSAVNDVYSDNNRSRVAVSQCSVWLRTGRPGDRGSIPAGAKDFSSNLWVQIGSGSHPASCTVGTGGPFPGVNRCRGVTLTTHPHLVPRSRMSRSYTPLPPISTRACSGTVFILTIIRNPWIHYVDRMRS
jgi:hypothetical protein